MCMSLPKPQSWDELAAGMQDTCWSNVSTHLAHVHTCFEILALDIYVLRVCSSEVKWPLCDHSDT